MPDGEDDAVWVTVEVAPDGTYFPAIFYGEDTIFALTRETAQSYGAAVLAVAEQAVHDSAFIRFLIETGVPLDAAGFTLKSIRDSRATIDQEACGPFRFEPVVGSTDDHLPWVDVVLNGENLAQWTPQAARRHATHVIAAPVAADLDAAAYRELLLAVEDQPTAQAAVMAMGKHRLDDHEGTP